MVFRFFISFLFIIAGRMTSNFAAEIDVKSLEKLKNLYGQLAKIPTPFYGRINSNGGNLIEVSYFSLKSIVFNTTRVIRLFFDSEIFISIVFTFFIALIILRAGNFFQNQVTTIWGNRALTLNSVTRTQRLSTVEKLSNGTFKLISSTSLPITSYKSFS